VTASAGRTGAKRSPVFGAKQENLQLEILAVLTALLTAALLTAALLTALAGLLVRLLTLLIVLLLTTTALLLATLAALLIALIGHQIAPWVCREITPRFRQTFLVQHNPMATLPAAVDLSTESIGGRPPWVLGPLLDLIGER
jgi:hypothetical protein